MVRIRLPDWGLNKLYTAWRKTPSSVLPQQQKFHFKSDWLSNRCEDWEKSLLFRPSPPIFEPYFHFSAAALWGSLPQKLYTTISSFCPDQPTEPPREKSLEKERDFDNKSKGRKRKEERSIDQKVFCLLLFFDSLPANFWDDALLYAMLQRRPLEGLNEICIQNRFLLNQFRSELFPRAASFPRRERGICEDDEAKNRTKNWGRSYISVLRSKKYKKPFFPSKTPKSWYKQFGFILQNKGRKSSSLLSLRGKNSNL